jgi:hypothetical protein
MSDQGWAQVIAAAVIALLTLMLWMWRRPIWVVATDRVTYTPAGGPQRTLLKGARVPENEVSKALEQGQGTVRQLRTSALSAIVVGKDQRASTSKTVAFAWTLAIGFGLISLLVANWLGDSTGWDNQVKTGLQEEYLLLLGGPFAAAVLAKTSAVAQSGTQGKAPAPVGTASPTQLVTDDEGNTDLGDFQYFLFNMIALAFFLGQLIGNLDDGFPNLPPLLTGLTLTSAGAYAAKKLIQQARPTLTSVIPSTASPGMSGIQIYGLNLLVPASASPSGADLAPTVSVGSKPATVTAHDQILGADRLTVTVATDATVGAGTICVVRADGIAGVGPAGSDGIAFTVT